MKLGFLAWQLDASRDLDNAAIFHPVSMQQRFQIADVRFVWGCAATIFLSAFLLFQVQPVIGKMVLPWFGGSPSVWTTCMLFFQVLLVGGYAYAHRLARGNERTWPLVLHGILLAAAVLLLPITPAASWKPHAPSDPTGYLLLLLAAHVGLPYFLLATTGPLVQAWFARVNPGRSPYRLYALSNLGSMGALLTYPFLIEPAMSSAWQGRIWSAAFVVFAILCGGLAVAFARLAARVPASVPLEAARPKSGSSGQSAAPHDPHDGEGAVSPNAPTSWVLSHEPTWIRRVIWVLLPALASVMLLAVTNHLCQDIAVSPLMWVVPLSLYLLSFIICFDRDRWYSRRWYGLLTALSVLAVSNLLLAAHIDALYAEFGLKLNLDKLAKRIDVQAFAYLAMLFAVCMLCHGELARLKPDPRRLTSFYLSVAIGGALGGLLVGVVFPIVLDGYYELNGALVLSYLVAVFVFAHDGFRSWFQERPIYMVGSVLAGIVGLYVVGWAQFEKMDRGGIARARNFYGVLSVQQHYQDYEAQPDWYGRALYHGRILHGYQYLRDDLRRTPTTYYRERSGVGLTLRNFPRPADRGLRVSVAGLGAGTLACYGEAGDRYRFYEINSQVVEFARQHFTFLDDCPAEVTVELGDARLSLEAEQDPPHDVLVLDAFSGDAIPAHLLTREAFAIYERRLEPRGVICVHVNQHLNLEPVVARVAREAGWTVVAIDQDDAAGISQAASTWLLVTRNTDFLKHPAIRTASREPVFDPTIPLWTDDYTNLVQIMF